MLLEVFANITLPKEMYILLIGGLETITRLLVRVAAHLYVIEILVI